MKVRTDLPLLIKNRGLSNSELSRVTGIPRTYVVYIVDGRMLPNDKQLELICHALSVTSDMIYPDPMIRAALEENSPRKPRVLKSLHDKGVKE